MKCTTNENTCGYMGELQWDRPNGTMDDTVTTTLCECPVRNIVLDADMKCRQYM